LLLDKGLNKSLFILAPYLFKAVFACGMPYLLPTMQKVIKKISTPLCRKELKFPSILLFYSYLIAKLLSHLLIGN
jgi:hypothetical protein